MSKVRRGRRIRKAVFVIELVILLALMSGVFVYAKINESFDNFQKEEAPQGEPVKVEVNEEVTHNEELQGFKQIALIGLDNRNGSLDFGNSDTMLVASINNDKKEVKMFSIYRDTFLRVGDDRFNKANEPYNEGSAGATLSMINTNLDLAVTDYVVVNFDAVAQLVDDLGGITITMTGDEVVHMNNYCVETAEKTGRTYQKIEPEVEGTYQLNGVQAVAYARIRMTIGNDFKRTQRQRLVIEKMIEKMKKKGVTAFSSIANDVFPLVKTNMSKAEIIELGTQMIGYDMAGTGGFPFEHVEVEVEGLDAVVPVTLENNVKELHAWLFNKENYEPSETVKSISGSITERSGFGEDYIEQARDLSEAANKGIGSEADSM